MAEVSMDKFKVKSPRSQLVLAGHDSCTAIREVPVPAIKQDPRWKTKVTGRMLPPMSWGSGGSE